MGKEEGFDGGSSAIGQKGTEATKPRFYERVGLAKFEDPAVEEKFQIQYYEGGRTLLASAAALTCIISLLLILRDAFFGLEDPLITMRQIARSALFTVATLVLLALYRDWASSRNRLSILQMSITASIFATVFFAGFAVNPVLTVEFYYRGISILLITIVSFAALIRLAPQLLAIQIVVAFFLNMYLTTDLYAENPKIWIQGQVYLVSAMFISIVLRAVQLILERRLFKTQQLLNQQLEVVAQVSAEKTRFLSALSHDLRQPLTGLVGYLDLVKAKVSNQNNLEVNTYLDRAQNSAAAIQNNLSRVLEIARLQDKAATVKLNDLDLMEVIGNINSLFEAQFITESIRLRVIKPISGYTSVRSDFDLLFQILQNLVANAIKYRRIEPGVQPTIIISIAQLNQSKTKISIIDNGMGIPKDQLSHVFKAYYQINNRARESAKGLGLGLSFVQNAIAKLPDHSLSIWSNGKTLTKLNIIMPKGLTQPKVDSSSHAVRAFKVDSQNTVDFTGRKFVLVEDNQIVRNFVKEALTLFGGTVEEFANAHDLMRAQHIQSPDLIIADYNLPGAINGYQLISEFQGRFTRAVPGMIITGNTQLQIPLGSEAIKVLYKPFNAIQLTETVGYHFNQKSKNIT